MTPENENAHVPAATGTKAIKSAVSSNLAHSGSTISYDREQIICRLGRHYYVRRELASAIIENSGIGGME